MSLQQSTIINFVKNSVGFSLVLLSLLSSSLFAIERATHPTYAGSVDSHNSMAVMRNPHRVISYKLIRNYAQIKSRSPADNIRSQSDVVREVKRQYDAEVLKITLNQQGSAYRLRILMPSGRVRQITVSAIR